MDISVVIGSYNRKKFLQLAILTIREELDQSKLKSEIIVIDGGSNDGSMEWLLKQKDIITIIQHNRGEFRGKPITRRSWGYFMNLGFKCSQGKYICMLSDDCLVVPDAIKNGVDLFENKLSQGEKVGAVAFYWRNWPKQKYYRVGVAFGRKIFVNHGLYLNEAIQEVGYAEEELLKFYYADVDLCLKLDEKGYVCIGSENSFIEHYAHANMEVRKNNSLVSDRDRENFINKWGNKFSIQGSEEQGDWIEKEWKDGNHTALKFKKAIPFMWKTRWKIKKNLSLK